MTDPAIKCHTFGDIISICERRGRINGAVQSTDRNLIKGYINEWYVKICSMKKWQWRNFDRTLTMKPGIQSTALTNVQAVVVQGSRKAILTNFTLDKTFIGRSIQFNNQPELWRIIGIKVSTNEIYLEGEYTYQSQSDAQFVIYQYEFPLPPDCDTPNQLYLMRDSFYNNYSELEYKDMLQFNRMMANRTVMQTYPTYYCVDGKTYANLSLPPLNEMILDWDFLGGDQMQKTERLRIYPIQTQQPQIIHLSYTLIIPEMFEDDQFPLIPVNHRWCLVHYALYEWFKYNGQQITAEKEKRDGDYIVKVMLNDWRKTQANPLFIKDARSGHREHIWGKGRRLTGMGGG